jgi:protein-tyrosine phosphatase
MPWQHLPLAEAAFKAEAARIGFDVEVDSAGIGSWHEGEPPDPRARATAKRHGVDIDGHRARIVTQQDFRRFSHIVALDHEVLAALKTMRPASASRASSTSARALSRWKNARDPIWRRSSAALERKLICA